VNGWVFVWIAQAKGREAGELLPYVVCVGGRKGGRRHGICMKSQANTLFTEPDLLFSVGCGDDCNQFFRIARSNLRDNTHRRGYSMS